MAFYDHAYDKFFKNLSNYANNLEGSNKETYVDKLIVKTDDGGFFCLPDPYLLKNEDWVDDISLWPVVKKSDIERFLQLAPGKNVKSRKAYEYVVCGKVQQVNIYIPNGLPEFRIVSSFVQPSQKLNKENYNAWIILKSDGYIVSAHCTCMAGFGEVCCHVSAILYQMQLADTMELTRAPTEKRCAWKNSSRKNDKSALLKDVDLNKVQWENCTKKRRYESIISPRDVSPVSDKQIAELKLISPNSVFFTSYTDDSCTDTGSENDDDKDVPPPIPEIIRDSHNAVKNLETLQAYFKGKNLTCVEFKTRSQRNSMWFQQHCGRLTSSNFGEILKKKRVSLKFIEKFTTIQKELNVPSVKWGRFKEETAFQAYFAVEKTKHVNFTVRKAGLFICKSDPYLACSPDGIVHCDCCGEGVLEIKCPFKYKNVDPRHISESDKTFCLNLDGTIKEQHSYFAQIQGQMAITNTQYCDLVIWTTVDFYTCRVRYDDHFWDTSKVILQSFYFKDVCPNLLS